jgi:hypothetical protein
LIFEVSGRLYPRKFSIRKNERLPEALIDSINVRYMISSCSLQKGLARNNKAIIKVEKIERRAKIQKKKKRKRIRSAALLLLLLSAALCCSSAAAVVCGGVWCWV